MTLYKRVENKQQGKISIPTIILALIVIVSITAIIFAVVQMKSEPQTYKQEVKAVKSQRQVFADNVQKATDKMLKDKMIMSELKEEYRLLNIDITDQIHALEIIRLNKDKDYKIAVLKATKSEVEVDEAIKSLNFYLSQ